MDGESKSRYWRWTILWREIGDRFRDPLGHPTFVLFFFFAVAGLGSAGALVELIKFLRSADESLDGLITALVTFFFALVGTSCTQICIENNGGKALKMLAQGILFFSVACVLLPIIGVGKGVIAAVVWAVASAFALAVWWVANAKTPNLRDLDAPIGGSTDRDLAGSTSGYTTD